MIKKDITRESGKKLKTIRNSPTLFPSGYLIKTSNVANIIFIDFVENREEERVILGSYALPFTAIKSIIKDLTHALGESVNSSQEKKNED